jgi:xanthine dehydrogenase accessory factor
MRAPFQQVATKIQEPACGNQNTMKDLLTELELWQSQGEEVALATVVQVSRSAPRPPGARLGVTRSGRLTGSVSGGCVEADVFERAMQVLDSGQAFLASYGISDELGFQVGLSCGGSIDVLIEPFALGEELAALGQAQEQQQAAVYATALAPPSILGRKLTLVTGQEPVGSISPGLDSYIVQEAELLMQAGGTRVVAIPGDQGEARVFLEAFLPPPGLVIIGATHTAISMARIASEVGFQVTVIDARSVLATEDRFPNVHRLIRAWPDEAMAGLPLGSQSSVVVLTHDPKFDIPALACALRASAGYIGALGSRVTHQQRKAQLLEQGFSEADLERIRAPIGLDIGARTPAELAVAILAEVLAVRYGRA